MLEKTGGAVVGEVSVLKLDSMMQHLRVPMCKGCFGKAALYCENSYVENSENKLRFQVEYLLVSVELSH
jgi:hypothetical protein